MEFCLSNTRLVVIILQRGESYNNAMCLSMQKVAILCAIDNQIFHFDPYHV